MPIPSVRWKLHSSIHPFLQQTFIQYLPCRRRLRDKWTVTKTVASVTRWGWWLGVGVTSLSPGGGCRERSHSQASRWLLQGEEGPVPSGLTWGQWRGKATDSVRSQILRAQISSLCYILKMHSSILNCWQIVNREVIELISSKELKLRRDSRAFLVRGGEGAIFPPQDAIRKKGATCFAKHFLLDPLLGVSLFITEY